MVKSARPETHQHVGAQPGRLALTLPLIAEHTTEEHRGEQPRRHAQELIAGWEMKKSVGTDLSSLPGDDKSRARRPVPAYPRP